MQINKTDRSRTSSSANCEKQVYKPPSLWYFVIAARAKIVPPLHAFSYSSSASRDRLPAGRTSHQINLVSSDRWRSLKTGVEREVRSARLLKFFLMTHRTHSWPVSGAPTRGLFEEGPKLHSRLVSVDTDPALKRHTWDVRNAWPLCAKASVKAGSGLDLQLVSWRPAGWIHLLCFIWLAKCFQNFF